MRTNPLSLSVLIANVNGLPMIGECLEALAARPQDLQVEVIVADAAGGESVRMIREQFPWVKLLTPAECLSIPQLRAAALAHSQGDIVAVIEDHCIVDGRWYEATVEAHSANPDAMAIGGAVENGSCDRLVDWAVFFCEYSGFMLPLSRGATRGITGNNVSYKRAAFAGIDDLDQVLNGGFWESTLHNRLLDRGNVLFQEPGIVVYHKKSFGFLYFMSQRYHYSRYYAGTLFAEASPATRLFRFFASLALPPLLLARISATVMRKGRHRKKLVQTVPLLVVFTSTWALGEMVGILSGPGQSLYKIE
jgi:glycosyltransferase involved in cell wall biosynthesis